MSTRQACSNKKKTSLPLLKRMKNKKTGEPLLPVFQIWF